MGEDSVSLLDPRGPPVKKLHWAMPALQWLSDGRWFGPYQMDAYDRLGGWRWWKLALSAAWGNVMGLVEIDKDGWWRIIPAGRSALAPSGAAVTGKGDPARGGGEGGGGA